MSKSLTKRVLLITYHFPPLTGGGVFRSLKFAKFLPDWDWQPIVLAAQPTSYDILDESMLGELPDSVIVHRVGHIHPRQIEKKLKTVWSVFWKLRLRGIADHLQPYKLLHWLPPDPYVTWNRLAFRTALTLIRDCRPSVILTTSPPHSTQLLGMRLRHATKLPWVVDFRDPWSENPFLTFPSRWHYWRNRKWEAQVLSMADLVISATDMMTCMFRLQAPSANADKFVTIHNGFDSEDFCELGSERINSSLFRILYTGSLYGIQKADSFLAAVDKLVNEGQIPSESLAVEFMGKDGAQTLAAYKRRPWFRHTGEQPHEIALRSSLDASVLLALVPAQGSYITSSKLFEYLRTTRPILLLAPGDSEAATIVRSTRAGLVVPPDDVDAIAEAIMTLFRSWEAGTAENDRDWDVVNSFDRRRLTGQLTQVLDRLVSS